MIRDRIYEVVDRTALIIGELLDEARRSTSKARYEQWVVDELPFGLNTARRLRAIYLAYRELPAATVQRLPRPWQAMYALASVERPALEAAISSGSVHPDMTVAEARDTARELNGRERVVVSQVDVWVARIVNLPADELSESARSRLRAWLEDSGTAR